MGLGIGFQGNGRVSILPPMDGVGAGLSPIADVELAVGQVDVGG
jgi:hypothetical protein